MEHDFWHGKWQRQEIGFHQSEINQHLMKHWVSLAIPESSKVFVPLCGKSLDMIWLLEKGYKVIGVELSPIAVEEFFSENDIVAEVREEEHFSVYEHEGLTIYRGDIFQLTEQHLEGVDVVYDRAALVALSDELRKDYVQHLDKLLHGEQDMLLVAMEYKQAQMPGPPFSIMEAEIRDLFSDKHDVHLLERFDLLQVAPMFKERGLDELYEAIYHISSKQ
ncbi:MAG: thiopurine S-methyltransferase [Gammaproteobacteria bacterium]|nr:thiopurine S-methyltransferase [Gammaproteobacteria bacterium]